MTGGVALVAFWALLIWLWAHPHWFAPKHRHTDKHNRKD